MRNRYFNETPQILPEWFISEISFYIFPKWFKSFYGKRKKTPVQPRDTIPPGHCISFSSIVEILIYLDQRELSTETNRQILETPCCNSRDRGKSIRIWERIHGSTHHLMTKGTYTFPRQNLYCVIHGEN